MLNDSRTQLYRIAAWLGVRTDAEAIEAMLHPEASPFAHPGPAESGVAGGNDPLFLRDPVPRKAEIACALDPPPGWAADPPVWGMVVALANLLGYV